MSETTNEKWTIENYIVEYDNGDATFWRLVDPKGDEQASDLCESEANLLVEKLNALTAANARVEALERAAKEVLDSERQGGEVLRRVSTASLAALRAALNP